MMPPPSLFGLRALRPFDIGSRALVAAIVPAASVAVALAWTLTSTRLDDLETALADRGLAIARQLAPASEYGVFSGNRDILQQLAEAAAREPAVRRVVITDRDGVALAQSGDTTPATSTDDRFRFVVPVARFQTALDGTLDDAAVPPRAPLGTVVVEITPEPLEARKRTLVITTVYITLAGLAIALGLAKLMTRAVTRPVLWVANVVERIGAGELDARAPTDANGVMGHLQTGVNRMAESLADSHANLERRIREATAELHEAKERAEAASRTKTQFLAAASHDLRQPLQALGLLISTLRMRARDDATLALVDRIEHAFGGLEDVLEALLDISKLDAGVVSPRVERFPIERVLASVRDTFGVQAAAKGLRLRVRGSRACCTSDPLLLTRIVSNLVSNAIRYTKSGGVLVGCRRRGSRLIVEVWDSGMGIPENARDAIFREFVQLANRERNRDQGLGLGLAIVDRLSRLLDHPITLRSRVGSGTVFTVSVPLEAPPRLPPRVEEVADTTGDLAGLRILAVDDDVEVLSALETFLSSERAVVTTATSLDEARARLHGAPAPDILLSDYRLAGGMDGIEVVRALRAEAGPMAAVILTGEAAPAVLRSIEASGIARVAKPVRPQQLKALLRQLTA